MKRLNELKTGERAIIRRIEGADCPRIEIAKRFSALGFCEGEDVFAALSSPFGGTSAYYARGALMAIRREDAEKVWVASL